MTINLDNPENPRNDQFEPKIFLLEVNTIIEPI